MQTIGERLLEARQRRGVSVREAAEATKIRGEYLIALESNQFDNIPLADVYKRGFLKIYAKFLRLEAERLVAEYNGLLAARAPQGARIPRAVDLVETGALRTADTPPGDTTDDFASGAIEIAERPEDKRRKTILLLGGGAFTLILLVIFAVRACSQERPVAPETPAPVAAVAQGEITFSCRADRPTPVRLVRLSDNLPVFERTMNPGESATFKGAVGQYELHANPLDKIHFNVNGAGPLAFKPGFPKGPVELTAKK